MHQHPRPPPVTASPASSERTNPTRTNNQRDRDVEAGTRQLQGLGINDGFEAAQEQSRNDMAKLNQVVQNFHTKAALIILHSRVNLSPVYARGTRNKRLNKWFNIELDETDEYRDAIMPWKTYNASDRRPPPLVIDILLDASELGSNQSLVILDEQGKRWDVKDALDLQSGEKGKQKQANERDVVLERWKVEIGERTAPLPLPSDLNSVLPAVYKKSIVLFRSLFTYSHFLPAWKFSRHIAKLRGESRLKLKYRINDGTSTLDPTEPDGLTTPLYESNEKVISDYSFGTTDSPAGPFSVQVAYRDNCEFRIDDAEALLSSRLLGTDEELFKPSLPRGESNQRPREREGHEIGSLPVNRKELYDRGDRGQAYGSLSTFHQVGPTTGSSPISALRNAQELGPSSPRTSPTLKQSPGSRPTSSHRPTSKGNEPSTTGRRPSINFQPFKAPPLSASPSPHLQTRPSQSRVSALSALKETKDMPPPTLPASATRPPKAQEPVSISPASNSPKPAPITRYSSSFSHRRARLSTGAAPNKTDEDQSSSGKGSAASSTRKGSGQGAERAIASSNSANDDDENISDFLKMLETKRDLLTPSDSAAVEASNRRTAAQLNRFHQIRNSTNTLSESMSSSLVLQRSSSSSSRQLSSVPPMVAATSVSTSSSPGKPISPHTPHTPAIPSRLSANSIIDYSRRSSHSQHRLSQNNPASPSEESASEVTATNPTATHTSTFGIPIPTSPRPYVPSYRRSSSVAQRRAAAEEETGDFYGQRSASAGAEDRSQALTLSTLLGQHADQGPTAPDQGQADSSATQPPVVSERRSSLEFRKHPPLVPQQGDGTNSGSASGGSSTQLPYRSRYSRGGIGRGSSGHGSSSSLITGNERGESGSGNMERRGGGRFSFGRESRPDTKFDEEEPLLFAMSDFGASRRSLEEARGGAETSSGPSVRRGNRRGRGGSGGSSGMPGGFPETWD